MKYSMLIVFCIIASFIYAQPNCTISAGGDVEYCITSDQSFGLDGTAAPLNAIPSTTTWTPLSIPSGATINIANNTSASTSVNGTLVTGEYTFEIQQECNNGFFAKDTVVHTVVILPNVTLANNINMGCWAVGDAGETIDLSTITIPSDVTANWNLIDGDGAINNLTGNSTTYTPPTTINTCVATSSARVRLTMSHNDYTCTDNTNFDIDYTFYDPAPVEIFGGSAINQNCGARTDLFASCQYNGVGTWNVISQPVGSTTVDFDDVNSNETSVLVDVSPGTYQFEWDVTGGCNPGKDTVTITYGGNGLGLVADAGDDINTCISTNTTSVPLNANALNSGEEGEWTVITGSANFSNDASPNSNANNVPNGFTRLRWTVTETSGDFCSAYDELDIQINREPTIQTRNQECGNSNQRQIFHVNMREYDRSGDPNLCFEVDNIPAAATALNGVMLEVRLNPGGSVLPTIIIQDTLLQTNGKYCLNTALDTILYKNYTESEINSQIISPNANSSIQFWVRGAGLNEDGIVGQYEYTLRDSTCSPKSRTNSKIISYNSTLSVDAGSDSQFPCNQNTIQLSGSDLLAQNIFQGKWEYISGPNAPDPFTAQTIDPAQQTPTLTNLGEGSHYFRYGADAVLSCNDAVYDTAKIVIALSPPPEPAASFIDDTGCPNLNNSVLLTGITPFNVLQGIWSQTSGPALTLPSNLSEDEIRVDGTIDGQTYEMTFTATNNCGSDDFTVAFTASNNNCGSEPLPVELINFYVSEITETNALLKWTTASETNNSHFIVMHSHDGISFSTIGTVIGQGTTSEINYYQFDINQLGHTSNYVKIVQVDYDGTTSTSKTIHFSTLQNEETNIYPTITKGIVNIKSHNNSTINSVEIKDINGNLIKQYKTDNQLITINLEDLPSGNYIIKTTTEQNQLSKLIFKL